MTADKIFKKVIALELYGPDDFMCISLKNAKKIGSINQTEYNTCIDAIKGLMVNCLSQPQKLVADGYHDYPGDVNTIIPGNLSLSEVLEDCGFANGQFLIHNLYNDWDNRFDGRLTDHKPTPGDHLSAYDAVRCVATIMKPGQDLKVVAKQLVATGQMSQQEYLVLQSRYNYSLLTLIDVVETQAVISNGFIGELSETFKATLQKLYDNFPTITIKDVMSALTNGSPADIELRCNEIFYDWSNRFDLISSVSVKEELL